jgi:hypothetical protein
LRGTVWLKNVERSEKREAEQSQTTPYICIEVVLVRLKAHHGKPNKNRNIYSSKTATSTLLHFYSESLILACNKLNGDDSGPGSSIIHINKSI